MKTFFMIIGAVIIIVSGIIIYLYQNVTYQPVHIAEMEEVDFAHDQELSAATYDRIVAELKKDRVSFVSSNELKDLIKNQISREKNKQLSEAIKKINCRIEDDVVTLEAVVNIKTLADIKTSRRVKPILNVINGFLPVLGNTGDIFVSIEGEPYNNDGTINFRGTPKVSIGDFSQEIIIDEMDKDFNIDRVFKDHLKISDFKMVGDKIKISR